VISGARGERSEQVQRNRSIPPSTVIPVLFYPDVRAAVAWLTGAFGFVERTRIGESHRAQLSIGEDGAVIVAEAGSRQQPRDGLASCLMKVRVPDVEAQYERARAQGARMLEPLTDQVYGERECTFEDLAGYHWQFSETVRDVAPEEYGCETVAPWP
jgi:uncharacterized glyoxalase superfamily protein PhnB